MDIIHKLTEELEVKRWQVEAAIQLIDEGNTIPFISRYRKEVTGSLNDEQLRKLHERLQYLRNLEEKKEQVLKSIEEQGQLTDELKEKINKALSLLTETQRRRVLMRFVDGLTFQEIAKVEQCDYTSVKESIESALKKIKKNF